MEANLAVLIDFENIAAGTEKEGLGRFDVQALMQRIKDKGRILISRSYADWGRFSRFKQQLLMENVTMMELTSHGMQDKNRADIALVVDALELAFTKDYIDTFVVVSGDSDFTPMVQKMRELNKRVIGVGTRKSTSRLLIQACDEFVFYDSIIKPATPAVRRPRVAEREGGRPSRDGAWGLLLDAVEGLQRENPDPPLAGIAKQAMLRKSPDFSESELGFGSFTRFLEAAQEAGFVHISRDTKSGGYRVSAVDSAAESDAAPVAAAPTAEAGDEYLPAGVDAWVDALDEQGLYPMSYSTRMEVLEAIVESVDARRKRRRKSTIQFVAEDVQKKVRRTQPTLSNKRLLGVFDALREAGQLIHQGGDNVRSASASFTLTKDAAGLNRALLDVYLARLREAGCELVDSATLAELFLGDRDRAREVEEALAWLASAPTPVPDVDLNDRDLDDLLLAGDAPRLELQPAPEPPPAPPAPEAPEAEAAPDEARKPRRRRVRPRAESEGDSKQLDLDSSLDDLLEPSKKS